MCTYTYIRVYMYFSQSLLQSLSLHLSLFISLSSSLPSDLPRSKRVEIKLHLSNVAENHFDGTKQNKKINAFQMRRIRRLCSPPEPVCVCCGGGGRWGGAGGVIHRSQTSRGRNIPLDDIHTLSYTHSLTRTHTHILTRTHALHLDKTPLVRVTMCTVAVRFNVLQCVAVYCSVLQYTAVC